MNIWTLLYAPFIILIVLIAGCCFWEYRHNEKLNKRIKEIDARHEELMKRFKGK